MPPWHGPELAEQLRLNRRVTHGAWLLGGMVPLDRRIQSAHGRKRQSAHAIRCTNSDGWRATEPAEGKAAAPLMVIEFPDYAAAVACYRSPEYAKAMALRQGKSLMDLAITEGYGGPQPGDT